MNRNAIAAPRSAAETALYLFKKPCIRYRAENLHTASSMFFARLVQILAAAFSRADGACMMASAPSPRTSEVVATFIGPLLPPPVLSLPIGRRAQRVTWGRPAWQRRGQLAGVGSGVRGAGAVNRRGTTAPEGGGARGSQALGGIEAVTIPLPSPGGRGSKGILRSRA